jgi:hypothetical protein
VDSIEEGRVNRKTERWSQKKSAGLSWIKNE